MIWRLLFGGSVAAMAGLKLYSDRAIRRAEAEHPPAGRFVTVDGARLHYLSSGAGQPVVLLHASGLALQDFALSIFDQVAAAHQAIAFDRPGYGYSERPAGEPLTLALNARLIHDALQSLGIEQPILVGNSYGGAVALRYALDYPDQVAAWPCWPPAPMPRDYPSPRCSPSQMFPCWGRCFCIRWWRRSRGW